MAITGSAFGEFDGINDIVLVPEPPPGVRRLVTSLRIINPDTVAATPSIRLRRTNVVPAGLPAYVLAFAEVSLDPGRESVRSKEIAVIEGFDLVASLAVVETTDKPIFHAVWIDLA
jgi:hypothetical protein